MDRPLLPMTLSMEIQTKVTDTEFEVGDLIGLYVVCNEDEHTEGVLKQEGNHYNNVMLKLTENGWDPSKLLWWNEDRFPESFYCYYPYSEDVSVGDYYFSVYQNQSTLTNYQMSDFICGKVGPYSPDDAPIVQLSARHLMSKICIVIKSGHGMPKEEFDNLDIQVRIKDIVASSIVDLASSSLVADLSTDTVDIIPLYKNGIWQAIVVPQIIDDANPLIQLIINGKVYNHREPFEFQSGVQHKFTFTLQKAVDGDDFGIGDWEEEEEDYGGSAD